jgi:hypothetical protein
MFQGSVRLALGCIVLIGLTISSQRGLPSPTAHAAVVDSATAASPSGQAMPVGDLPGWHQIFADDFITPVATGSFPGTVYGNTWSVYANGSSDTSGNGQYAPSRVLSVANGLLSWYVHTENGVHLVAAALPKLPTMTYGRYSVRFRADMVYGYKTAWLLWPNSGNSSTEGEIDFPESCTGLDGVICAFLHRTFSSGRDYFGTGATYGAWHTATIEWTPGKCSFLFDGQTIGTSTSGVPTTAMHWVLQTETATWGEGAPSSTAAGTVQVDWVTAYSWIGGSSPTPTPTSTAKPLVSIGCTTGSANPSVTHANWTEYLGTYVKSDQTLASASVSFEVYNAAGARISQMSSGALTLMANSGQWIKSTWQVPSGQSLGTYTVKILVYGPNATPVYATSSACTSFTIA